MGRATHTTAISPTNASRCWKKEDLGPVWDGCWVDRDAMVVIDMVITRQGLNGVQVTRNGVNVERSPSRHECTLPDGLTPVLCRVFVPVRKRPIRDSWFILVPEMVGSTTTVLNCNFLRHPTSVGYPMDFPIVAIYKCASLSRSLSIWSHV